MTNGAAEMRLFSEENMKILLFRNFNKKQNSTKRPADAAGVEIDITLKDPTSWTAPVFVLQGVEPGNYVKWEGRYYYVNDCIRSTRGIVQLVCSIDALATAYSDILATAAMVRYSSSDYTLHIRDERLLPTMETSQEVATLPSGTLIFNAVGCYIVTVISDAPDGTNGAATVYAMTKTQVQTFMAELMTPSFWEMLKNEFNNPMEALVSCNWIPFSVSDLPGTLDNLRVANQDMIANGYRLTGYLKAFNATLALPYGTDHTDTFLDCQPFNTGTLYLPFVGCVPLDLESVYPSHYLTISMQVDLVTGDIAYLIGASSTANWMRTYHGSCASRLPISSQQTNLAGALGGIAMTIGGAAMAVLTAPESLPVGVAALAGAAPGMTTAIRSSETHTQTNGSISSRIGAALGLDIVATFNRLTVSQDPADVDRVALMGLPCNKVRTISGLTGYVQTSGFNLAGSQIQSIRDAVNAAMDAGVYIE